MYKDRMRPALPSKEECRQASGTLKHKDTKNFITSNAVENILAVPKREEEGVDWLKKPHFGEVPPYLLKIKTEIADEYEYIKSMQQQQMDGAHRAPHAPRALRPASSRSRRCSSTRSARRRAALSPAPKRVCLPK